MARDATEAMSIVSSHPVDLVLCDIKMPGINGLELVRQIHEVEPDLPCIVITGYSTAENSIEALRAGAFWYLEKPFEQERLDVIRRLVDQAIEHGRLKAENRALHSQLQSRYKFDNIVGKSQALQHVLRLSKKSPTPTARFSLPANPVPEKNSSPAPCTTTAPAPTA